MLMRSPRALADLPVEPWKNGGGITRTLASFPDAATLDTFTWRISLAAVAVSGPFSAFSGVDRTIVLWSGHGMALRSAEVTHPLTHHFEPYSFSGDEAIEATLIDGPTTDINIMTRLGHATSTTCCCRETTLLDRPAQETFLISGAGIWSVECADRSPVELGPGEFMHISGLWPPVKLEPKSAENAVLVASIYLSDG
jgi:environmental stress-induced protein Ves